MNSFEMCTKPRCTTAFTVLVSKLQPSITMWILRSSKSPSRIPYDGNFDRRALCQTLRNALTLSRLTETFPVQGLCPAVRKVHLDHQPNDINEIYTGGQKSADDPQLTAEYLQV